MDGVRGVDGAMVWPVDCFGVDGMAGETLAGEGFDGERLRISRLRISFVKIIRGCVPGDGDIIYHGNSLVGLLGPGSQPEGD